MRIAAIGNGNIGGTLGSRWAEAGHQVRFGVREPGEAGETTIGSAIVDSEIVLLAVPGGTVDDVLAEHGDALAGRTVIDATNAVGADRLSHVAEIAAAAPSATVVRAFNTVGWEVFADPVFAGESADLFWCGPDGARERVEALVRDIGMNPVRVGDSDSVEAVDGVARLWFALVFGEGHDRRLGFRVLG